MIGIKAIETYYKGYRFRSRLEARWAVFFDAVHGNKWEYEKEGFNLGKTGWYLPDFYIHHGLWVEIKPQRTIENAKDILMAINKCAMLAFSIRQYAIVIAGNPWPDEYKIYPLEKDALFPALIQGDFCFNANGFVTEKHKARVDNKLMNAFIAARSARFEHGESPKL